MRCLGISVLLLSALPACASSAADLAGQLQQLTLDPAECYHLLEFNFSKEDLKVYLTSGYLIFSKPTDGLRLGAVFVTSQEAGDAEVLLLPPTRSERLSLATFTGSPNLEEHFKVTVMVSTDGTGDELWTRIHADPSPKKSPEMGRLLADQYTSVLRNLTTSFTTRAVYDLLSGDRGGGLFYMAVSGNQLGNFDVLYDPTSADQILVGKLAYRNNRAYFDTWTAFQSRSFRRGAPPRSARYSLDEVRLEATIQPDLTMQTVERATLALKHLPGRAVPINLSPDMRVTEANIDGQPVEVFESESLRSNLIARDGDRQILLVCAQPLDPARSHEIEIRDEGAVIRDAGDHVYYVASRDTWYPRGGGEFAQFDITFRYPSNLTVVASGKRVSDRTEGEWRTTRLQTQGPIRFAGFNLGDFESVNVQQDGYNVDVYANRRLESALLPPKNTSAEPPPPPDQFQRRRRRGESTLETLAAQPPPEPPDPTAHLHKLAQDVADTLDFLTRQFGPTSIRQLSITPIPGTFGQGFPGLVYLSTLAYLNPGQLPARLRAPSQTTFYSELLEAHEVAHQWWGNLVIPASYHDDWLIESLANYSALLLLEKKKGIRAVDDVLEVYRNHLLSKTDAGRTLESTGPITWGGRLESSLAPDAWQAVTYEKGTWIIHMLRRRLGDEKFLSLLRDICDRYRLRPISTEEFRQLAAQYAPPSPDPGLKLFFENWVDGIGIPVVKLSYSWRGSKLTGEVSQSDVDDDFTAYVPVEVQTGRQRTVYWLATSSDPVPFSIPLKSPPAKVSLLADDCLLRTSK